MSDKKSRWESFENGSGQAAFYSDTGSDLLLSLSASGIFEVEGTLRFEPPDRALNHYALTVADRLEQLAATIKEAARHARQREELIELAAAMDKRAEQGPL